MQSWNRNDKADSTYSHPSVPITAENLLVCLMAAAPVFFELAPEKSTIWYDKTLVI